MPGFLMHLVHGQMTLDELKKKYSLSESFCHDFLLGSILPDITTDKELTHFRKYEPPVGNHTIKKYPDADALKACYEATSQDAPLNPLSLGILAHLYLDAMYVTDLWDGFFTFEDECGNTSTDTRKNLFVHMKETVQIIPLNTFFSKEFFYGDYDITNPYFLGKYAPKVPAGLHFDPQENQISQCQLNDQIDADIFLRKYLPQECFGDGTAPNPNVAPPNTNVIPTLALEEFMAREAKRFVEEYAANMKVKLV